MGIAEKLTTIAENEQKVYDAALAKSADLRAYLESKVNYLADDTLEEVSSCIAYQNSTIRSVWLPSAKVVRWQSLRTCPALTSVYLPEVIEVSGSAFRDDTGLTVLDFPKVTVLKTAAFYDMTNLTALIIRTPTLCTLQATNVFTNTPIATGTGSVYVPASLVSTYQSAENWSAFKDQITSIEGSDYEEYMIPERPR